jgi:hypothetical protein
MLRRSIGASVLIVLLPQLSFADPCSLTCATILGGDTTSTSPLATTDSTKIKEAAIRLKKEQHRRDIGTAVLKGTDWMVAKSVGYVPVLGTAFDMAFKQLEDEAKKQAHADSVKQLDKELSRLIDLGTPASDLKNSAQARVELILGTDSPYVKELGLITSEYDELQNYAIKLLADEVDNLHRMSGKQRAALRRTVERSEVNRRSELKALYKSVHVMAETKRKVDDARNISGTQQRGAGPKGAGVREASAQQELMGQITLAAGHAQVASSQMASAASILRGLGASGDVVNGLETGSKVLDAAAELAKGLANPLAFLPAVARVFGIFGSQDLIPYWQK